MIRGLTVIKLPWPKHPRDNRPGLRRITSLSAAVRRFAALSVCLLVLSHQSIVLAEGSDGLPRVLRFGLLARILPDTDVHETQVAVELWAREMSHIMGYRSSAKVTVFSDPQAMCKAVRRGNLDIASLTAVDYLKIRNTVPLTPAFVAANNVGRGREHLLITHRDSGIRDFSGLRGKTLLLLPLTRQEPSHIWLDVLLMKEGKKNRSAYFHQVRETASASQAIMAVFFRQADAAIVSRGAFETAVALNPQLERRTRIIAESSSLAGDIVCIPDTVDEKMKRTITNAAMEMHKTAVGRQMGILFQVDRIIPYRSSYLDGLSELLREQAGIRKKLARGR